MSNKAESKLLSRLKSLENTSYFREWDSNLEVQIGEDYMTSTVDTIPQANIYQEALRLSRGNSESELVRKVFETLTNMYKNIEIRIHEERIEPSSSPIYIGDKLIRSSYSTKNSRELTQTLEESLNEGNLIYSGKLELTSPNIFPIVQLFVDIFNKCGEFRGITDKDFYALLPQGDNNSPERFIVIDNYRNQAIYSLGSEIDTCYFNLKE